jgi:hypothetical protein
MRYVLILLALAACGDRSVGTIQATGLQTPAVETTRTPRDVVACLAPLYDQVTGHLPAQMRITPSGFELFEMSGLGNRYFFSLISINGVGDGSAITGFISADLAYREKHRRKIEAIIRQCAQPDSRPPNTRA